MNKMKRTIAGLSLCGGILALPGCSEKQIDNQQQEAAPAVTNRLDVPPDVVNNLGITYQSATRGRLGVWREVPGELEVPESHRWTLRAPARARILSVVPRWQAVEEGAVLATLASPEVQRTQSAIALAERTLERATNEVAAARERLAESEIHLGEAKAFEQASRKRLDELIALDEEGNPLPARELIEARRNVTEASKARLDAAVARDDLVSRVAQKQLEADQARLAVNEQMNALAVLTGVSAEELGADTPRGPRWRDIEKLTIRAPAAGVVVELTAAQGEIADAGTPVLQVFDTRELRFRGHLPEGDQGSLAAGSPVRLEFPSRRLQPVDTELAAPIPVADAGTRMVHVEAVVPNEDGALAHGMSVMAHVLVERGNSEEVLIPVRCVVFDGLEAIVFKRDASNPNVVIRTPVELGARATDLVEVIAGVLDGDELVADGIHQLKQTGLGKAPEGVHFHADGTWHGDHK
ncbi:MAG: efflux RND transporter periplasmic adaptor subunit [Planctomycetes bacterium]|nr:efflux RND transporter periplasmic adaptor subunit [Planctomycetota bacterium]